MFAHFYPEVARLRAELAPLGLKLPDSQLWRLLTKMNGDVDLALTALLMTRRPAWLVDIVGPR